MRWRKHRDETPAEEAEDVNVTLSAETRRARDAALAAGRDLADIRAQRPQVEAKADELDDLNRHNGFYGLIRQAMGA